MKYGYIKVAAAAPFVRVADCFYNIDRIEALVRRAVDQKVEVLGFPELSITGYTAGDLLLQPFLLEQAEEAVLELANRTADTDILFFVGMPLRAEEKLYNAAVGIQGGRILGAIPKTFLPNYREFQEKRWFSSSYELAYSTIEIGDQEVPIGHDLIFRHKDVGIGVEICEDMWAPITPGVRLSLHGAHIIFNLSASNENAGKNSYLRALISGLSSQAINGYVYSSCGHGESSTDLVYTGKAFIAENGTILKEMERFDLSEKLIVSDIDIARIRTERMLNSTFRTAATKYATEKLMVVPFDLSEQDDDYVMTRPVERNPFMPGTVDLEERSDEIFKIQVTGLMQRLRHLNNPKMVIGVSGGLDSTLALLVCCHACKVLGLSTRQIIGVTMPAEATSDRTKSNADKLMELLDIDSREIPISAAAMDHLRLIGHDAATQDTTYENAQARERTQILMDLANMEDGIVIGTGDLSELALGWCTYNGDHMSMYGVNASIPKTSVQMIVTHLAGQPDVSPELRKVLLDIVATPVSPELTSTSPEEGRITQRTEELIGPYEVHDFFIFHMIYSAYSPAKILYLAQNAFGDDYTKEQLKEWMKIFVKRFISQQFKRNCSPDGPKVGAVSLSSRGCWRMPSDASADMWLNEIDKF